MYDLRKLLEFVGRESLEECSELHHVNKELERKAEGMSATMELSHKGSSHLQRCAMYWG